MPERALTSFFIFKNQIFENNFESYIVGFCLPC